MGFEALLGPNEYYERYHGKFFGKYRAVVKKNNDPKGHLRVRLYCPDIWGEDLSPWATPCLPLAASIDSGGGWIPPVDALVWAECEQGSPETPIYVGGYVDNVPVGKPVDGSPIQFDKRYQDNPNSAPAHVQGIPDGTDFDGGLKGQDGVPASNFAGKYPHVRTMRSPGSGVLEFDDTPAAERVHLGHVTGSHLEFLPDGSSVLASAGKCSRRSSGESNRVEGNVREQVIGSKTTEISGDWTIDVGGRYTLNYKKASVSIQPPVSVTFTGSVLQSIQGSLKQRAHNNVSIQAGGSLDLGAMGNYNLQAQGAGSTVFSNVMDAFNPFSVGMSYTGQAGIAEFKATDATGFLSRLGIEIMPLSAPSFSPIPNAAEIGPHIFIGNLLVPPVRGPGTVPLLQEPVPLGFQLTQYLIQLNIFLKSWLADYLAHAHPTFSPAYTALAQTAILPAQLSAIEAAFLLPSGLQLNPLIVSDIFYTSKQ